MHVAQDTILTVDLDQIPINKSWNVGVEKECPMHNIHAYPAKFPSFITTKAIQYANELGINVNYIADVFCGCGTVAYETLRSKKHFWGCDINPVATLIAETKSKRYDANKINIFYKKILDAFITCEYDDTSFICQNERVQYWFYKEQIIDLYKLRSAITASVDDHKYLCFFLCAFSNILKSCSKWLTKSIKPQVDPNKKVKDVINAFDKQIKMMVKANEKNQILNDAWAKIETNNILEKKIDSPFVDLVITSPPYVTSYEYADLHQLSTLWLGYTSDFKVFREGTIGSLYHSDKFKDNIKLLNEAGKDIVFRMYSADQGKARAVAQYYVDMQKTSHKVYQMIKNGGGCFFVIGNTEYKGVKIDNVRHLAESLLDEGFHNVDINRRKITNKILTPYRDEHGKFTSNKNCRKIYSEEFIIFGQK